MSKTVLVTGGMGGIGEAICTKMARTGHRVATTYSPNNGRADEWSARMQALGYDIAAVRCDVTDGGSCQNAIGHLQERIGPIDILVNNAGVTRDSTLRKMNKDSWDTVINTNLNSLFNVTKPIAASMAERGWGRIINISSVNGFRGAYGQVNYAAAKAGMHGFTKSLALELARKGVTVNTIAPGYIATKMTMAVPKDVLETKILPQIPIGRLGQPEEVAALVAYVASDDAAFLTGANLCINGGQYML